MYKIGQIIRCGKHHKMTNSNPGQQEEGLPTGRVPPTWGRTTTRRKDHLQEDNLYLLLLCEGNLGRLQLLQLLLQLVQLSLHGLNIELESLSVSELPWLPPPSLPRVTNSSFNISYSSIIFSSSFIISSFIISSFFISSIISYPHSSYPPSSSPPPR